MQYIVEDAKHRIITSLNFHSLCFKNDHTIFAYKSCWLKKPAYNHSPIKSYDLLINKGT